MDVIGIVINAGIVAFGMILSFPTKISITFLLMKKEAHMAAHKRNILSKQLLLPTIDAPFFKKLIIN
jgi:hypothetical protein